MCKKKSRPGGPWPPKGGIDGPQMHNKGIRRRRGCPPRVRLGERTALTGPEPPSKFQAIRSGSDASRPGAALDSRREDGGAGAGRPAEIFLKTEGDKQVWDNKDSRFKIGNGT